MLKPILILAATFVAAAATPAVAGPLPTTTRVVSYRDLDLASAAGQARFDQRVTAAVRALCGTAPSVDLAARRAVQVCRTETRANVRTPVPAAAAGTR